MKFNFGMILALVATNQLAAAAPINWNGKNAEAACVLGSGTMDNDANGGCSRYKTCSVAGAAAYMACRNTGHPVAGNVAAGGAVVAAGAEAAVKWSQSPMGQEAGKKVATGASAVKCAAGKVCNAAGKAIGNAASSAAKAGSKIVHSVTGGGKKQPDVEMGSHHRRAQDDYEYSQLAAREPETDFEYLDTREPSPFDDAAFKLNARDEDVPLYTRYAEIEPKSENKWDEIY